MMETSTNNAIADQRLGRAGEKPFNWVTSTKIQNIVNDQYDRARNQLNDRLAAIYADHLEKGLLRSGITLKVCVETFEDQTGQLIANLVREITPIARDAGAFALIAEGVEQFLAYLDEELERIVERIHHEFQNSTALRALSHASKIYWGEKREALMAQITKQHLAAAKAAAGTPEELPVPVAIQETGETPMAEPISLPEPVPLGEQWHEMWADLAIRLYTGKFRPNSQSDVSQAMADLFTARGIAWSEVEVRDCARRLWAKYAALVRITSSIGRARKDREADSGQGTFNWLANHGAAIVDRPHANPNFSIGGRGSAVLSMNIAPIDTLRLDATEGKSVPGSRMITGGLGRQSIELEAPAFELG